MNNAGWIKLHRSIKDNPKLLKGINFALWCYILISVVHIEEKTLLAGNVIVLKPGQGVFSTPDLANKLGFSVSGIRRALNWLESEQQIEQQKTTKGTVITVVNWNKYQQLEQQNEQELNNNRTTTEQQLNNLPYYIKNDKNDKNNKKEKIYKKEKPEKHQYGEYKNVLLSDEEIEKLKTEFPLDWQERIEKVSEYCASHGKAYKDYLATIRNWARKDKEKLNGTSSNTGQNMDRKSTGIESRAAEFEAIIRAAQERGQAGTVGEVQAGASVSGQDLRTSAEQGELPL